MKQELTASKVFSSMTVFDMLREQLHMVFWTVSSAIQGKVSLDRVNEFLKKTELLDQYTEKEEIVQPTALSDDDEPGHADGQSATAKGKRISTASSVPPGLPIPGGTAPPGLDDVIGFSNASFTWSAEDATAASGTTTPFSASSRVSSSVSLAGSSASATTSVSTIGKRAFVLRVESELIFRRGRINLVIGPTGSGKTSLLMALLGEMHFVPAGMESWYHLPRAGGLAYAAQESWVQNETIRDNILFSAPFDEERYKKVIHQCCLERDLELFEAGDKTEVGEKGLTLSGGQKARITLARAIYSHADTVLLDDVLAALDVHTAKWIVEKCFSGDLIEGRTVILVTHNVAMASPVADFVVTLGTDGRVVSSGSVSEALAKNKSFAKEVEQSEKAADKAEELIDDAQVTEAGAEAKSKPADGKLIVEEEIEEGHVGWPALKMYFSGLGGSHTLLFFVVYIGGCVFTQFVISFQTWFLGHWAAQYDDHDASEVSVVYYLSRYSMLLAACLLGYVVAELTFYSGVVRASRRIHQQLVESVLGTTLRWLDTTPTSRVIARCTQDIRAVDGPISQGLMWLMDLTISMLIRFAAVILFTPIFVFPGIFIAFLGGWCGQIYIAAQLSVKREMSNAKSPVLGHFGAAIAGLTSIRAYGAQDAFKKEMMTRIDRYTRAARTFYNLNRWICIRIDALGGMFSAGLAAYLFYFTDKNASNTGFSLNMAVAFSSMILWWVRILNDFEVQGNSLERIQGYVEIEQEPRPTEDGKPPAYWPSSGELVVENLSARYSANGPKVLHDISFRIKSGERVGVVGRTGSGKSSLTLSLLRCIYTEGNVQYDGIPTASVNLDALRSSITIIPQVPELLSGTLRQNLDPFSQYDDATLNDALRAAGLFSLQSSDDESRITLDSSISSGGSNLSVGQRQILALARAIVRGSKLLILDEATSAIDYKTDSVIQSSLRNELGGDVTLITVAHRLQTIMDADKIMVLDAGRIVEFDSPKELLKNKKGKLRALVDESGDREALIAMAESTKSTS
ncbi:hypothetical protein HGRIS_007427 [Hohenbuehelia grisea]|uniref:P-loop containing nucleoside triphosphate hydrolase protein n=1 Tax=Hohenbuehelia grisea TaxID=104357 RepID=A0ABR3J4R7_9AGAR